MIMTVSLSSHRHRRVIGRDQPDENGDRPEPELIPVFDRRPAADLFAAHVGPVLASQIFKRHSRPSTMMRAWRRETPGTSKRMSASSERPRTVSPSDRNAFVAPDHPAASGRRRDLRLAGLRHRRAEPVAKTPHGPDELRLLRIIVQHLANLGDQNRQASIGDERVRPEM